MPMDFCLHDILYEFFFLNHPEMLENPEAFSELHELIHVLLQEERRKQLARMHEKIVKVTRAQRN